MPKVLLAIPAYHGPFYDDNKKTGLFYVEASHPYEVFKKHGFDVDIVSETGKYGFDEHSITKEALGNDYEKFKDSSSEFNVALQKIKPASAVNPQDYAIAYAAAGHGALFSYPKDTHLRLAFQEIYANGGVVSAVCHGPAIFDGLTDTNTKDPIISGKKITGFTDIGETQIGVDKAMEKFQVETIKYIAGKNNATYIEPNGPWDNFTVVDGKIVTGVNPQSAASTAEKAVGALKGN